MKGIRFRKFGDYVMILCELIFWVEFLPFLAAILIDVFHEILFLGHEVKLDLPEVLKCKNVDFQ